MAQVQINRKEIIQRLVACSVKEALLESPAHWLNKVFEDGFIGYSRLSTSQLLMEMEMHGLIEPEVDFDDESQETDTDYTTDLIFN
jgi:hypothetical protein